MKKVLLSPIWSILIFATVVWTFHNNPSFVESFKLSYFDQLIAAQPPVENNIYTVNIDETAIAARGQWPWSRDQYAEIIQELYNRDAGLVVWMVLMPDEDRAGQDHVFAETVKDYPVILNMLGGEHNRNSPINPGAAIINSQYIDLIPGYPGIIANVPIIENAAIGSGIVNTFSEIDGITRRVPLVFSHQGTLYPNVTMEVLRVIAGDPSFQIRLSPDGVDRLRIPQFGIIPTDYEGQVWIDWSQQSKNISLTDLPESFDGGVVFVTPTAAGISNPLSTAIGGVHPHQLQAALLGTVFNQSNINRPGWAEDAELLGFVAAGLLLILLAYWTWVGILFFVVVVVGSVIASMYAFSEYSYLVDGATLAAGLLLIGIVRYVVKFLSEFLEKQAIKKQFAGYASPTVVKLLQENPQLVKQGVKKEISICFSDLRGFTNLGEKYGDDVKGLTEVMNGYMDAITQPVLDANGMIIKYIGDASMHIHGAPIDDKNHAHTAVRTGLNMLKAVDKYNQHLAERGIPKVGMGAGINTGVGYLGEMGSKARHSYDVLGDSVSTTARLESQCKNYGVLLIVGPETVKRTEGEFFYLKLDDLAVKGKSYGLDIYTVLDVDENSLVDYMQAKQTHNQMHQLYQQKQFQKAIDLCDQLCGEFDSKMDGYYSMWIERCEFMKTQPLPDDWNGVFIAQSK